MKNRRMKLSACAVIMFLLITSSNLNAQVNIPDINGVKEVKLSLACKLELIQGDKAKLEITGDSDDLQDIHVRVIGDRLVIDNHDKHHTRRNISIELTLPDLTNLSIEGSVRIETPSPVFYQQLDIEVSGVADLFMRIKSTDLKIDASGVIDAEFIGETKNFTVDISGIGKVDAESFKSENCDVEVSGMAKANVYATETLLAEVSGVGSINYDGNPRIRKRSSGIGLISKR